MYIYSFTHSFHSEDQFKDQSLYKGNINFVQQYIRYIQVYKVLTRLINKTIKDLGAMH